MSSDAAERAAIESAASEVSQAEAVPDGAQQERMPGVLELAWPAVLGNLAFSTVGLVDIKIVGSLGAYAVAAVTTGHRIFFVLQAVMIALSAGTTALVARAWGAGDKVEANRVTMASAIVCCIVAGVLTVPAVVFARELAGIFDLDPRTLEAAAAFIAIMSCFNVAFALSMVLGTAVRAAGDTRTPLFIGLVTNVVNVFFVYGLVYGRFGFPQMGVRGAALASGMAFGVGALISVVMWFRGWLRVAPIWTGIFSGARVRQLVRIGYPAGLEQGAVQIGFIVFLWIVSLYGTAPYAAYGIGVQILSFSFVVGFGFSIAASTHVGQRLGAGDPEGASQSGWRAMWLAVGAMVLLGGSIILFAREIAEFMIDDAEVVRLTVVFIYILGAVQPLMAIEFTLGGALRGAGDTRFPLFTTLTGIVFVRGGLAWVAYSLGLPVEWIFAVVIADWVVKSVLLVLRFRSGRWKLIDI